MLARRCMLGDPGGRAPRGARGLKYQLQKNEYDQTRESCPSRGTWIEIRYIEILKSMFGGRAPRGARGLK